MSAQGVRKVPTVAPYQDNAGSPGSDAFAPELHEREVLSSARSLALLPLATTVLETALKPYCLIANSGCSRSFASFLRGCVAGRKLQHVLLLMGCIVCEMLCNLCRHFQKGSLRGL